MGDGYGYDNEKRCIYSRAADDKSYTHLLYGCHAATLPRCRANSFIISVHPMPPLKLYVLPYEPPGSWLILSRLPFLHPAADVVDAKMIQFLQLLGARDRSKSSISMYSTLI